MAKGPRTCIESNKEKEGIRPRKREKSVYCGSKPHTPHPTPSTLNPQPRTVEGKGILLLFLRGLRAKSSASSGSSQAFSTRLLLVREGSFFHPTRPPCMHCEDRVLDAPCDSSFTCEDYNTYGPPLETFSPEAGPFMTRSSRATPPRLCLSMTVESAGLHHTSRARHRLPQPASFHAGRHAACFTSISRLQHNIQARHQPRQEGGCGRDTCTSVVPHLFFTISPSSSSVLPRRLPMNTHTPHTLYHHIHHTLPKNETAERPPASAGQIPRTIDLPHTQTYHTHTPSAKNLAHGFVFHRKQRCDRKEA